VERAWACGMHKNRKHRRASGRWCACVDM
jgi:hypothetical protein